MKLKKMIGVKNACNAIIFINVLAIIMHVLILFKVLPSDFVWGARLQNESQLVVFEIISITVQLVFILIVAMKAGYIFEGRFTRIVRAGIWLLFIVMVLNTVGNLASNSSFETFVMTPITAILAVLLFRLGAERTASRLKPV